MKNKSRLIEVPSFRFIVLFTSVFFCAALCTPEAHASLLIRAPIYIGLNSGLKGYWSFNQADVDASTVYDRSGNGNNAGASAASTTNYTTAGTFTLKADQTGSYTVQAWGGGGGGGQGTSNGAGGGGGGAYSSATFTLTAGSSYTVVVGSAGTHATNGTAGGDSSFQDSSTLLAKGGSGGQGPANIGGAGGLASEGVGITKQSGGTGGNGDTGGASGGGGGGGSATASADGGNGVTSTGASGGAGGTGEGAGGSGGNSRAPGSNGTAPGGGGGGAGDGTQLAGDGAVGRVVVTFNGSANYLRTLGRIGQAAQFDGVNHFMAIADNDSLSITGALTISGWYQYTGKTDDYGRIFGKAWNSNVSPFTAYAIHLDNGAQGNQKFTFAASKDDTDKCALTADTTGALKVGVWYHVAGVFRPGVACEIYVNGVLDTSVSVSFTSLADTTGSFRLADDEKTGQSAKGTIDEVRIYNRALSEQEIIRLYNIGGTMHIGASQNQKLTNGLVGLWSFDSPDMANGTAYDRSGSANNGTLTNGPSRAIGKIGQGLSFDGVNDFVTVSPASSINNLGPVTISAWIKPNTDGEGDGDFEGGIVLKDSAAGSDGHWFGLASNNRLVFWIERTGTALEARSANNSIQMGAWQHVLITWDGSNTAANIAFYVNGIKSANSLETNGSGTTDNSANALVIGGIGDGTWTFDGQIDDVRVYNRALNAQEIKRLYNIGGTMHIGASQNKKLTNGLVGLWSFDSPDMANGTAYDRSGSGNDGTLTNGPARAIGKLGQGLDFDGVDDYVLAPQSAISAMPLTLSAWVRADSAASSMAVTVGADGSGNNEYRLALGSDGTVGAQVRNTSGFAEAISVSTYKTGTWHHVVAVFNSTIDRRVYLDGGNEVINTTSYGAPAAPTHVSVGRRNDNQFFFDGQIDDVRIYNRALSAAEIKRLYNMGHMR